ncbi:transcriptional regulator [Candidatus Peregrinibacteria bacterium CG10_big_fil_rev_8_21_14_0_10_36_19]|nr:MAG: transcriptional regulator [Candidatus Peregrinibacteria bacterium CG10_big_fil_rev_8_21_14_0_10_36_19]
MEQEDYLETIYKLKEEKGLVRISDIAEVLQLSKPSVTQMMQRLEKEGCIEYKPYYPIELTTQGKKIGKGIAERHEAIAEFLTLLEIPNNIQEKDIHGIEHSLSPITLKRLKEVTKFLKNKSFKPKL